MKIGIEADIGHVQEQQHGTFTVDAFQDRQFPALITQVRFAPKTVIAVMQCAGNRRADMQQVRKTSGDGRTGFSDARRSRPSALTFSNSKLMTSTAAANARRPSAAW